MKFLGRGGGRRTKAAVVGTFAGTLLAFQALGVIGAQVASASVTTCAFSGGVLALTIDAVAPNPTVIGLDGFDQILVNGALTSAAPCSTAVATAANTTTINVTGGAGAEDLTIDLETGGASVDFGAINWTVTLGSEGVGTADDLLVTNAGSADAVTQDWGASGIDLNGDANLDVSVSGADTSTATAGAGGDTINAGGSTATGAAFASAITINGGAGDDTLTGGAGNDTIDGAAGDDTVAGGAGDDALAGGANTAVGDTVDYSGAAAGVTVNLNVNAVGSLDTLATFENVVGSGFNDTLNGDGGDNVITPGAGDDAVDGNAGSDTVDYSDATAPVEVDLDAGTATGGSGNDTISDTESVQGSDFNDTLSGDAGDNGLFGGAGNDSLAGAGNADDGAPGDTLEGEGGIDTVDYSSADSVILELNCSGTPGTGDAGEDIDAIDTMENAILTAGDDEFFGNTFGNKVWPNGGQNSLDGDGTGGVCGAGAPAAGGDVLDYSVGYDAGVSVNMAGGTTAGDSAVGFENARGTKFADNFTGNGLSNTLNGGGGDDSLKGGSGDDTLRGARGNDSMRGGSGDDDLIGGKGKQDAAYGGTGVDLCRGAEIRRGCEIH